jgi:hypothetical protein
MWYLSCVYISVHLNVHYLNPPVTFGEEYKLCVSSLLGFLFLPPSIHLKHEDDCLLGSCAV